MNSVMFCTVPNARQGLARLITAAVHDPLLPVRTYHSVLDVDP